MICEHNAGTVNVTGFEGAFLKKKDGLFHQSKPILYCKA
jgi:hypothetical protein